MIAYTVTLKLLANTDNDLMRRIEGWELDELEGLMSISTQPVMIPVPPGLAPPPLTPLAPPVPLAEEEQ